MITNRGGQGIPGRTQGMVQPQEQTVPRFFSEGEMSLARQSAPAPAPPPQMRIPTGTPSSPTYVRIVDSPEGRIDRRRNETMARNIELFTRTQMRTQQGPSTDVFVQGIIRALGINRNVPSVIYPAGGGGGGGRIGGGGGGGYTHIPGGGAGGFGGAGRFPGGPGTGGVPANYIPFYNPPPGPIPYWGGRGGGGGGGGGGVMGMAGVAGGFNEVMGRIQAIQRIYETGRALQGPLEGVANRVEPLTAFRERTMRAGGMTTGAPYGGDLHAAMLADPDAPRTATERRLESVGLTREKALDLLQQSGGTTFGTTPDQQMDRVIGIRQAQLGPLGSQVPDDFIPGLTRTGRAMGLQDPKTSGAGEDSLWRRAQPFLAEANARGFDLSKNAESMTNSLETVAKGAAGVDVAGMTGFMTAMMRGGNTPDVRTGEAGQRALAGIKGTLDQPFGQNPFLARMMIQSAKDMDFSPEGLAARGMDPAAHERMMQSSPIYRSAVGTIQEGKAGGNQAIMGAAMQELLKSHPEQVIQMIGPSLDNLVKSFGPRGASGQALTRSILGGNLTGMRAADFATVEAGYKQGADPKARADADEILRKQRTAEKGAAGPDDLIRAFELRVRGEGAKFDKASFDFVTVNNLVLGPQHLLESFGTKATPDQNRQAELDPYSAEFRGSWSPSRGVPDFDKDATPAIGQQPRGYQHGGIVPINAHEGEIVLPAGLSRMLIDAAGVPKSGDKELDDWLGGTLIPKVEITNLRDYLTGDGDGGGGGGRRMPGRLGGMGPRGGGGGDGGGGGGGGGDTPSTEAVPGDAGQPAPGPGGAGRPAGRLGGAAPRAGRGSGGGGGGGGGGGSMGVPDVGGMTEQERNTLGLIRKYESHGQNVMNFMGRRQGISPTQAKGYTAQGYYQMLNSNWKRIAPLYGITAPNAMAASDAEQTQVALHLLRHGGIGNWSKYNPALRSALARGEKATMDVPQVGGGAPGVPGDPVSGGDGAPGRGGPGRRTRGPGSVTGGAAGGAVGGPLSYEMVPSQISYTPGGGGPPAAPDASAGVTGGSSSDHPLVGTLDNINNAMQQLHQHVEQFGGGLQSANTNLGRGGRGGDSGSSAGGGAPPLPRAYP